LALKGARKVDGTACGLVRRVRQEQAQGILVAALGMLAAQGEYALAG
jgi:hypothetical protein